MKKRIFAACMAMLLVFTLIAPAAVAATPEKVYITVEANGYRYTQHAYKSGSTLLVPVTMLTQFGGMRYSVSGSNYTFYYKPETSGARPISGARRIFLNVGKKTVQTVYYPTSSRYVTVMSASLSSTHTANGEHYIPLEELLPLLDAKVEIGKDGIVHIQNNPMPLFRALHYARPDLFPFGVDEYVLGDVVTATGLIVDTIMGRYDRLDIINGSGAVKDYSDLFKKFLTINETYMSAFDKKQTPIEKGIKEIEEAADNLDTAVSGTKDMLALAEYMSTSSQYDTYKEFSTAVSGFKDNAAILEGAIKVVKFADTYINQVEDHRNMLNAVYNGGSAPVARAANEIYTRYGKDTASQLTSVGLSALREYLSDEVTDAIAEGTGLKPYQIAFSAVQVILPKMEETFSESAELFYLDKVVEDARAAAEKGLSSNKVDKASLEKLRLSLIMYLVAVKYGYDTHGELVDSSSIDTWLEMLYLAADSVECVSSDYYAGKKAELKKSVSSVKTTNGSDGKTTKKTTTKATKNTTTKATKKTTTKATKKTTTKATKKTTATTTGTTNEDTNTTHSTSVSPKETLIAIGTHENLVWTFDTDGVLTISGTGEMKPLKDESNPKAWVMMFYHGPLADKSQVEFQLDVGDNYDLFYEKYCRVEKIVLSEGITTIADSAFVIAGSNHVTSVVLPSTLTDIGEGAFAGCGSDNGKLHFELPDGIEKIRHDVFASSQLTSIRIPKSVREVGWRAFGGCTLLKDVYYAGTEEEWEEIFIDSDNECLVNATIHFNS